MSVKNLSIAHYREVQFSFSDMSALMSKYLQNGCRFKTKQIQHVNNTHTNN